MSTDKRRYKIALLIVSIIVITSAQAGEVVHKPLPYLGVKFYRVTTLQETRSNQVVPEYLGKVEWQEGVLHKEIMDGGLENLFNHPYLPQRGEKPLKPGTREHLSAIASEGWQFGVITQITGSSEK